MSRFTRNQIEAFMEIGRGMAREIDENTWVMNIGPFFVMRVTKTDDGEYEAFCADDDYDVQAVRRDKSLFNAVQGALYEYKVQSMAVTEALKCIDDIPDKDIERLA